MSIPALPSAEITIDSWGPSLDIALARAVAIAVLANQRVILTYCGTRCYPVNPEQVLDDVRRRLEGRAT